MKFMLKLPVLKKSLIASYFISVNPQFPGSVIFIYEHTDIWCKAIIINKMNETSKSAYGLPIYYGGSDAVDTIIAIHTATAHTKQIAPSLHISIFYDEISFIEKPKSCFFATGFLKWHMDDFLNLVNQGFLIYSDVKDDMILTIPPAYRMREANAKAHFMGTMPIVVATS